MAMSVEGVKSSRIASCIVIKNDIISFGINQMKSHPFQAKYSTNRQSIYLHSEVDAIKNAARVVDSIELEKAYLYIVRMKYVNSHKKNMIWAMSKPCVGCQRAIAAFNLKRVIYSTGEDDERYKSL